MTDEKTVLYCYDGKTRAFIGTTYARDNPKEPGTPLIRRNSTTVAPGKIGNNQTAIFDKSTNTWKTVPDFRGKIVTNVKTYETKKWTELGPLSKQWTHLPRPKNGLWSSAKQTWIGSKTIEKSALIETIASRRQTIFKNMRWRIERYASEKRLGKTPTDNIKAIDKYMDQLRNLDQLEGYPEDFTWPTPPWKE